MKIIRSLETVQLIVDKTRSQYSTRLIKGSQLSEWLNDTVANWLSTCSPGEFLFFGTIMTHS